MIEYFQLIESKPFLDERGFFQRTFSNDLDIVLNNKISIQSNISYNKNKYTLRGFHYESKMKKEWKLMSIVQGSIYLVVIDLRKYSNTYKKIIEIDSRKVNNNLFYIPAGYANAFLTLENKTIISYSMGEEFIKGSYEYINWQSEIFKEVAWPYFPVVISEKDRNSKKIIL